MAGKDRRLGVGILGAASIARKNVKAIGKTTNGLEVVAVGSRTLSKAEAFIKETGLEVSAKAYGSYEEVLSSPDVDAVYLPLPTATHLGWVKKAAAHKKHILLEKPIALSIEETDGIVKACRDAGVMFMDGTMFVHNPRTEAFAPYVRDREGLGEVKSVTSTFTWAADADFLANDVRTRKDGDALGCYGDIGWYCIKAALWAFQFETPELVQAHPGAEMNKNGVVMHGGGTIVWSGGRRLVFNCGFTSCHSMYLQDFCIPYNPERCKYVVKGPATWLDNDTIIEQSIEEKKVELDRPQETHMWEAFGECVYRIKGGGSPDEKWAREASICNKLCIAVEQSAQENCKPIDVKGWF